MTLFYRHKIQKALLSPDVKEIKEDVLPGVLVAFRALEKMGVIEPAILRSTKINKVMRFITRMDPNCIPNEAKNQFIKRAGYLKTLYDTILAEDDAKKASGITNAVGNMSVVDRGAESTTTIGESIVGQGPVVSSAVDQDSGDKWVYVTKGDTFSDRIGIMTRHPGWVDGSVTREPEDICEEVNMRDLSLADDGEK